MKRKLAEALPFSSLVEVVRRRADEEPERLAYTFLTDSGEVSARLTYAGLDRRVRALAATLQDRLRPGDRALLLYPSGPEYVAAFLACLYAGVVAVPAYPPRPRRTGGAPEARLQGVVADAEPAVALTTSQLHPLVAEAARGGGAWNGVHPLATDGIDDAEAPRWREPGCGPDTLAFLQYTSGATAAPRGVMVTHGNLLHNQRMIRDAFGQGPESVIVGWLPLYHDMGLIGNVLHPLYVGAQCVLMSPMAFLRNPLRWLECISRFGGTTSGGPNFAYDLCVRKIAPEERAKLDLRSWRVAFNGAEPVHAGTLERFAAAFAPAGFRPDAFYPCYGLAEATLLVSARRPGTGEGRRFAAAALEAGRAVEALPGDDGAAFPLVSCGRSDAAQEVIVVDPADLSPLPAGTVGEVWVSGPSVAQGYRGRPEETLATFGAVPRGGEGGPYLRTGDLGFLHDGELYVTGRLKELIIVRGRNLYPQDLERTAAEAHPAARPGCGAAFPVEVAEEEAVVVVQEVDPHLPAGEVDGVIASIRQALGREHEVQPHAVVLVRAGSVPKTSSGKLQRRECRQRYLGGALETVAASVLDGRLEGAAPGAADGVDAAVEDRLRRRVAEILRLPPGQVPPDRPLGALGLDSLSAAELQSALEAEFGAVVPLGELLEGPSVAELARRVGEGLRAGSPAGAPRRAGGAGAPGEYPASRGQRALWFMHQISPDPAVYNIVRAARVRSRLDAEALRRAFAGVVARHASLRTVFVERNGEPVQRVHAAADAAFRAEDASAWTDEELHRRLDAEARAPFDLEAGPLVRVLLLARSEREHVLLLAIHHIVADLWSLALVLRELSVLYAAEVAGAQVSLPALPLDATGYAAWQDALLEGAEGERLREFWRERLAGAIPVLELPTDRRRPPVQTYAGAVERSTLPAPLAGPLRRLGEARNATLYATLLASFQALLHRYTGQEDLIVGSPAHGRTRPELAQMVGYLANLLPMRADASGAPSFHELLDRVREWALAALRNQDFPFDELVRTLRLEREASRSPLFQVVFVLQTSPLRGEEWPLFALGEGGAALDLGGLSLESVPLEERLAQFDLTLTAAEAGGEVYLAWSYNTDLFEPETIRRMARHFEALVEAVVAAPERPLADLPLLSAEERVRLEAWSGGGEAAPAAGTLVKAFEAVAARRRESVAVSCGEERLTYGELNARANRLAHHLRARGVGPESRVGVSLERGPELVVALLGVLKAGGAYVPLDPAYPSERRALIRADAGVRVVVAAGDAEPAGVEVVRLDGGALEAESAENPDPVAEPENLAYIIYTSGSTGRPKGTLVSHRNVLRLFAATEPWFGFGPDDVWTLFHSFAFDFSVWELWGALLHGGRLVVVPFDTSRDPEAFRALLARERVTVLNQTPSAFRQLIAADAAAPGESLALRLVVFGGEALEPESLRPWFSRHGEERPRLVNMYGITETTVHVTYQPLGMAEVERGGSAIGRGIPDLKVYVLDGVGEPAPVGVPGELYVGGAGVARGYLGRPELTAERFVPDAYGGAGARLYRSGDRARWRAEGVLEYLGRLDEQVKVRGFRIEPGEIEAALREHPEVADTLVVVREEGSGERRLVGYVVPRGDEVRPAELRRHLEARLPEYMVPRAWVSLKRLPLTENGKVNRRALPAPALEVERDAETPYVAPRTAVEEVLAGIWEEVLGVERVGVHDNFFVLGGDSIRSIRVISLAREAGVDLSVQQLFRHQSVAELARVCASVEEETKAAPGVAPFALVGEADRAALPAGLEDAYPLTRVQAGLVFHSELQADYVIYCVSTTLRAPFDPRAMRKAAERLIARHPVLRTSYDLSRFSEPLQLVHRTAPVPLQVEDLRPLSHAEQEAHLASWIEVEKRNRFDWTTAPLIRLHVHLRTEDTFQFSLSHSLFDGWSTAAVTTELFETYFGLLRDPSLPEEAPLTSSFVEFVALEQAALRSEACRAHYARVLGGGAQGLLPRWPGEGRDPSELPVRLTFVIPPEVVEGLRRLARTAAVPFKSTLVAAHLRVLSAVAGHPSVVTGLITGGRPHERDGEKVIGMFLNAAPVRLDLAGGSWTDLVRDAFRAEQEMLPNSRYPYAELQRQHGAQPIFETAFNIINFHIYRKLQSIGGWELTDRLTSYDQTFFGLTAYFELDVFSSRALLHLDLNTADIGDRQLQAMGGYYLRALALMAGDPSARYESQSLLAPEEAEELTAGWRPAPAGDDALCVHRLFEDRVPRHPERPAVTFGEEALTYGQLDERASLLAGYLRSLGVGPEERVGIHLERGLDLPVAILGVLKAGGAYVPLDPAFPRERIAYMAGDARLRVVLTLAGLAEGLPDGGPPAVCLDRDWPLVAGHPAGAPEAPVHPDNLMYVMYTSGSTGLPKGVQVPHGAVAAFLQAVAERPGIAGDDVLLAVTTSSFDISVLELFLPLSTGARVEIAPREAVSDGGKLLRRIVASGATVMQATPATWRLLLEEGWEGSPGLTVLCGGESLPRALADRLLPRCGALWNMYGPTEATVWASATRVAPGAGPLSIGDALPGARLHLLDVHLQPVPTGTPGELYIGGSGIARGYLGRPELTAERFVPDPFSGTPGARMYRTGDLARRHPGGVEFLGRVDDQVKVRGFRIELGEIEATLLGHPAVRDAAVALREYAAGDARLVAYLVADPGAPPTDEELRLFLKGKLPEYAVPGAFVPLAALPRAPNGKLDRRALPTVAAGQLEPGRAFVAPRTPLEERVARIWADVLHLEQVGVDDSFFALGGHSLLATQAVSRVRAQLGVALPLGALFENPTVAGMSAVVQRLQEQEEEALSGMLDELEVLSEEEVRARIAALGSRLEAAL